MILLGIFRILTIYYDVKKNNFYVMKEKVRKQIEIVNGDSREAIVDLINSNPRLSSEAQLAIIEKQDKNLFKTLMSFSIKILTMALSQILR